MPQFLAEVNGNSFTLPAEEARHIKVSRVKCGHCIKLFDAKGNKYEGILDYCDGKHANGTIQKTLTSVLPKRQAVLCFCAISRPATEDLIDKCTQAGVFAFQPVFSARSDAELLKKWDTKLSRWQQIALAAVKQCETPLIPAIYAPISFAEAVKKFSKGIICYEDESKMQIKEGLAKFDETEPVAVFIGPEGGFEEDEIKFAKANGLVCVSLGTNILRAETAATVACWAALQ